ncbi:hypothetical protein PQX77_005361 [Marasmius sp. AFHP31]|nr:hypothetical protein PQX77_005361 [Marasmius sp. AFHP31]
MPPKNRTTSHTVNNLKIKRSAINPRNRSGPPPKPKPPPLTPEQRKAAAEARAKTKAEIKEEIRTWLLDAKKKAETLANRFNKSEQFFLDMMFQNGVHLTSPRKTNPYNAFKYFKSKENRETGGKPLDVEDLDELYGDEYDEMSDEEKKDLVMKYEAEVSKEEREKIKVVQPNARARAHDVANVVANIMAMLNALSLRLGVEAMFMIVRSHHDPFMVPTFGWTNDKLRDYMPLAVTGGWNTERVGTRCEGFAIAGCDTSKMASSKKTRALLLRNEIKLVIDRKLSEILGVEDPAMEYVNFDKKMTYDKGIVIEGWPIPKFAKPSDLGSCEETLRRVRDNWVEGRCHFKKLSPEEHAAWRKAYDDKVKTGEVAPKVRQTQSDAGKPRKKPGNGSKDATGDVEMKDADADDDDADDAGDAGDAVGDMGNADIEMTDGTRAPDSTSAPDKQVSSSVKAAKSKKKESKTGAKTTKKRETKAAVAGSKAQKEAQWKKGKSKEGDTHPDPTVKERPKPRKKGSTTVATDGNATTPPVLPSTTASTSSEPSAAPTSSNSPAMTLPLNEEDARI